MMIEIHQTNTQKKTYSKPQVTEVRMVAEEAVLSNCKNAASGYDICVDGNHDTSCYPQSGSAS
jgi:hypothetical protein